MKRDTPQPETLTMREAAARLGIGLATAYRAAADGELPGAFRIRGCWRVRRAVLDAELSLPEVRDAAR